MAEYVLNQNDKRVVKVFTLSGVGETDAIKFNAGSLNASKFTIKRIAWSCKDVAVRVIFDRTGQQEAVILSGNGVRTPDEGAIEDKDSGLTGNIKFTTVGAGANSAYWIEMEVLIHP